MIDFDAVVLDSQVTVDTVRGTPGYFPYRDKWRDGSAKWDVWSIGAILLEANLRPDEYHNTKDET